MKLNTYQGLALETAVYPKDVKVLYPLLGLAGEAGEVADKYKKVLRGDKELDADALAGEVGDVLWYVAVLAFDLGYTLEEIAQKNVVKLASRLERGVIKGDGDTR